jgi:hypothetical protein
MKVDDDLFLNVIQIVDAPKLDGLLEKREQ